MADTQDEADAMIDVTPEVLALADQIHDLFAGHRIPIIPLAIGTVLGTAIEDRDMLAGMTAVITAIATQVHFERHRTSPEGTMLQ